MRADVSVKTVTSYRQTLITMLIETLSILSCIPSGLTLESESDLNGVWTCIKKWHCQIDFTITVTTSDISKYNNLNITFSTIGTRRVLREFYELIHNIIIDCPIIIMENSFNPTIFPRIDIDVNIGEIRKLLSFTKCNNADISIEAARDLAEMCYGESDKAQQARSLILQYESSLPYNLLNNQYSMIIIMCGQSIIQQIMKYNNSSLKKELCSKSYDPYKDNSKLSTGISYANLIR